MTVLRHVALVHDIETERALPSMIEQSLLQFLVLENLTRSNYAQNGNVQVGASFSKNCQSCLDSLFFGKECSKYLM